MHVAISELSEDDLVIVRTGSAIPVDGVVAEGEASVNQGFHDRRTARCPALSRFVGIRRTVVEEGEIAIRPRAWATARASGRLSGSSRIRKRQGRSAGARPNGLPMRWCRSAFCWPGLSGWSPAIPPAPLPSFSSTIRAR